jgi:hypothetical protein
MENQIPGSLERQAFLFEINQQNSICKSHLQTFIGEIKMTPTCSTCTPSKA